MSHLRVCLVFLLATSLIATAVSAQAAPATQPPAGLRETSRDVHAIVGATIVVSPNKTIDRGTLVVRDGVIAQVGAKSSRRPTRGCGTPPAKRSTRG